MEIHVHIRVYKHNVFYYRFVHAYAVVETLKHIGRFHVEMRHVTKPNAQL